MPKQYLTLNPGCAAQDSGIVLPNINDGYTGMALDLGAYEIGAPLPQYGSKGEKSEHCSAIDSVFTGTGLISPGALFCICDPVGIAGCGSAEGRLFSSR